MTIQHRNRKGKIYYLHQGTTKTGKPKYFFSMKSDGDLMDEIPPGYEIYENPNSQVFIRKAQPKLITDEEKRVVKQALEANPDVKQFLIDVKKNQIIIHTPDNDIDTVVDRMDTVFGRDPRSEVTQALIDGLPDDLRSMLQPQRETKVRNLLSSSVSYSPMMRFDLEDEYERTFVAMRYCFRGSIDDWIYIGGPDKLSALAEEFVPHLEKESFFELY